jgi:hypothetical protein
MVLCNDNDVKLRHTFSMILFFTATLDQLFETYGINECQKIYKKKIDVLKCNKL